MKRRRGLEPSRRGHRSDVYNPLTGNRRFFTNLEDGNVPDETRRVDPPTYQGAGQRFVPRRRPDEKG